VGIKKTCFLKRSLRPTRRILISWRSGIGSKSAELIGCTYYPLIVDGERGVSLVGVVELGVEASRWRDAERSAAMEASLNTRVKISVETRM
jgi:hypothetical protein